MKRRSLLGGAIAAIFAPQAIAASSDQRIMQSLASTLELANKMSEVRQQRIFDNNLCKEIYDGQRAVVGPKEGDYWLNQDDGLTYTFQNGKWEKPIKIQQSGISGAHGSVGFHFIDGQYRTLDGRYTLSEYVSLL